MARVARDLFGELRRPGCGGPEYRPACSACAEGEREVAQGAFARGHGVEHDGDGDDGRGCVHAVREAAYSEAVCVRRVHAEEA